MHGFGIQWMNVAVFFTMCFCACPWGPLWNICEQASLVLTVVSLVQVQVVSLAKRVDSEEFGETRIGWTAWGHLSSSPLVLLDPGFLHGEGMVASAAFGRRCGCDWDFAQLVGENSFLLSALRGKLGGKDVVLVKLPIQGIEDDL